jgi:hypothetical protein
MSVRYGVVAPGLGVNPEILDERLWYSYTPQIIITGAGTAPSYLTNSGRFNVSSNKVFVDILFDGDGGTAGAGAGQLSVLLPVIPSPLRTVGYSLVIGYGINGATEYQIVGSLSYPSIWAPLSHWSSATAIVAITGGDQSNTNRNLQLHFWYEAYALPPL